MSELTGKDIEQRMKNYNDFQAQLEANRGGIDFEALYEGAERAEQERADRQRKLREQQKAERKAEGDELNELLKAAGEANRARREAQASKEAQEKAEIERQKAEDEARKANNLKTSAEMQTENALKGMLKGMKL